MDPELLEAIQNCTATADWLLDLLEQDEQDMPNCINGEILAEYQKGTEEALRTANAIKADLIKLQTLE